MTVTEQAHCTGCGTVTHQLAYTQFLHIVHAAALRDAAAAAPRGTALDGLLHGLLSCDTKPCGGGGFCGEAPIRHLLMRNPEVFTISLAWDTAAAPEAQIAATMAALGMTLRPGCVYDGPAQQAEEAHAAPLHELRALVCYCGGHYASFARTDDLLDELTSGFEVSPAVWTHFNHASATHVGSWQAVCNACAREQLQPALLFFERPVMMPVLP
jgi:hypothetical protein